VAQKIDIKDRLKKIETSLNEANREDRFDNKIRNIDPIQRRVLDDLLNIEIDDDDSMAEEDPKSDANRVAKTFPTEAEAIT
jgi:hypothetical protein